MEKTFKTYQLYDEDGNWQGYYLEGEEKLAEIWAEQNNGTVKVKEITREV